MRRKTECGQILKTGKIQVKEIGTFVFYSFKFSMDLRILE
jgi:hypothetical protein